MSKHEKGSDIGSPEEKKSILGLLFGWTKYFNRRALDVAEDADEIFPLPEHLMNDRGFPVVLGRRQVVDVSGDGKTRRFKLCNGAHGQDAIAWDRATVVCDGISGATGSMTPSFSYLVAQRVARGDWLDHREDLEEFMWDIIEEVEETYRQIGKEFQTGEKYGTTIASVIPTENPNTLHAMWNGNSFIAVIKESTGEVLEIRRHPTADDGGVESALRATVFTSGALGKHTDRPQWDTIVIPDEDLDDCTIVIASDYFQDFLEPEISGGRELLLDYAWMDGSSFAKKYKELDMKDDASIVAFRPGAQWPGSLDA